MALYTASIVYPMDGPPIPDGAVQVEDGRVVAVGPAAELRRRAHPGDMVVELPGRAIVPGLIDAHHHLSLALLYEWAALGFPAIAIHRGRLQQILVAALSPAKLHLGKSFVELAQELDGVRVRFGDGAEVRAWAVVGADGARSTVRRQLFPDSALRYSGQSSYRGVAPVTLRPPSTAYRRRSGDGDAASALSQLRQVRSTGSRPLIRHQASCASSARLSRAWLSCTPPSRPGLPALPAQASLWHRIGRALPRRSTRHQRQVTNPSVSNRGGAISRRSPSGIRIAHPRPQASRMVSSRPRAACARS